MITPAAGNQRRAAAVAAGSTLLAALPLATVFQGWTWLVRAVLVVAVVGGAGVLARTIHSPPSWVPPVAMLGGLTFALTWLFPSGEEIVAGVPSVATLLNFVGLLEAAGRELPQVSALVADHPGLLFLAVLGIGLVTVLVDVLAVGQHRPALAGLPMLAMYSVPVAVEPSSTSIVLFLLGAAGFLWLLGSDQIARVRRFGQRFTGDGRAVDFRTPSALSAAGQRLGLVATALAVLVPLAVPGLSGGLLARLPGGADPGALDGSGPGSGSVSLLAGLTGALNRDREFPMLTVSTTDPQPHYLRFAVADHLDGNGFANRPPTTGVPVARQAGTANRYRTVVDVHDFNMRYLPVYLQPGAVTGVDSSWRYDANTSVVYSDRGRTRSITRYRFEHARPEYPPEGLRRAPATTGLDPVHRRFTSVPTRVNAVEELVATLAAGQRTAYDKVRALVEYFSTGGFTYSVTTQPGTSGSQIQDFLTNKKGFCVQYAAALAWLVRAAGIPARVAVGFTRGGAQSGGDQSGSARPNSPVVLTNFNLHAWTEVYFTGFGWVPFDATPRTAVAGLASPVWAPNPTGVDRSPAPPEATPAPGGSRPVRPGADPTPPVSTPGPRTPSTDPPVSGADRYWWLLAGVLLLALPAISRRGIRHHRLRRAGARTSVHAAWNEFRDTMTDYRIPFVVGETPRGTAARVVGHARLTGTAARAVHTLAEAESYARYARDVVNRADLRSPLRTTRSAIAAQASRRTRIAAVLVPPSVVRRWARPGLR